MNNKDLEIIKQIEKLNIEIVKVVGKEVNCKCPKHSDSNPSFFFNLDTGVYHCFAGCLKGRGIHQLIFQLTGVSVAGVPAKDVIFNKLSYKREEDRKIIPSIPLLPLAVNNIGEEYLNKRGITTETIKYWNIQYWQSENAIVITVEDKGYIIRYINKDAPKKYKYVTGTKISETLFGLSKLDKLATSIILVEGSLDCIYLHQLGFHNALALLHADITRDQIKILGGVTDYVYTMLDGDQAGINASLKIRTLLGSRFIKRICTLPMGKDPDNLSKEEIEKILKEAI